MILQFAPEPLLRGDLLRSLLKELCEPPMPPTPVEIAAGEPKPATPRLTPAQRLAKEIREKATRARHRERLRPAGCLTTSEAAKLRGIPTRRFCYRCKKLMLEPVKSQGNLTYWREADLTRLGILPERVG